MKITIKNTSASPTTSTVLADGGASRALGSNIGPEGLRIVGAVSSQLAEFLRGDNAKVFKRGNHRTEVSFRVYREFAGELAAEYWMVRHAASVDREDTLYLDAQDGNGNTTRVTLSNCVLTIAELSHIGVGVNIAYQIIGGQIS